MNSDKTQLSKRKFLGGLVAAASGVMVLPTIVSCAKAEEQEPSYITAGGSSTNPLAIPISRPTDWNPIDFNLQRGLKGAVPSGYQATISGADGPLTAIGKHIPFIAPIDKALIPAGFIALMIGDSARGYAKHPAAAAHWFDWITLSKNGSTQTYRSDFPSWPNTVNYLVFGGGDISAAAGVNTIYLASLPTGTKAGDTIRVVGHCNLHGEYVDFLQL